MVELVELFAQLLVMVDLVEAAVAEILLVVVVVDILEAVPHGIIQQMEEEEVLLIMEQIKIILVDLIHQEMDKL